MTKAKIPETIRKTPISETGQRMLVHAAKLAKLPVPERPKNPLSAFDHPTVGRASSIANNGDRARLCSLEKPCAICQQRIDLGLLTQPLG